MRGFMTIQSEKNEKMVHILRKIAQMRVIQCRVCKRESDMSERNCELCHKIERGIDQLFEEGTLGTIKMAFYKAQRGDFWGKLIAGYTGIYNQKVPAYCHVEIGIPIDGVYKWYSSASKNTNGMTGTRWMKESVLFKHPERWDVYDVAAYRSPESMFKTCVKEDGKPYDWMGIAGFATVFGQLNLKKKWYCSEICNYVFYGSWKKRISPKGLYKKIKKYIINV